MRWIKGLATSFMLVAIGAAADAVTDLRSQLQLSDSQWTAILHLNQQYTEFEKEKQRQIGALQAKQAVNPGANVSAAMDQIQRELWNKLEKTGKEVRATLTQEQCTKVAAIIKDERHSELAKAAESLKLSPNLSLERSNGPHSGPVTLTQAGSDIDAKTPASKRK